MTAVSQPRAGATTASWVRSARAAPWKSPAVPSSASASPPGNQADWSSAPATPTAAPRTASAA
ncbi:hypothetical protein I3J15_08850 [Streptomyces clavuligerus]|nr:hypothetical protein I3J15_08850 [Streptomyces clavuligerus]